MGMFLNSPQMLLFDVRDRVARITLNRPEKRNTLSNALLEELQAALLEADARQDVNVVVLAGAGKDFCAGYDLTGTYAGRAGDAEQVEYRTIAGNMDDDCWQLERTQRLTITLFDMH